MDILSPADRALLRRVEENVMGAAARGREVIDVGPFRAFIARGTAERYYSYAVPMRDCEDWSGPLEALCAAFEARDRIPRFEYLDALWPGLLPALEGMGFIRELVAPLMVLSPDALLEPPPSPATLRLLEAEDDISVFTAFEEVKAAGFGAPPFEPAPGFPAWQRERLAAGDVLKALAWVEGVPACCGTLMRTDAVAELAAVATAPAFRRRGIAASLCAALARAGYDAGLELIWLSAGSEDATALYRRLGFRQVSQQLHCSRGICP